MLLTVLLWVRDKLGSPIVSSKDGWDTHVLKLPIFPDVFFLNVGKSQVILSLSSPKGRSYYLDNMSMHCALRSIHLNTRCFLAKQPWCSSRFHRFHLNFIDQHFLRILHLHLTRCRQSVRPLAPFSIAAITALLGIARHHYLRRWKGWLPLWALKKNQGRPDFSCTSQQDGRAKTIKLDDFSGVQVSTWYVSTGFLSNEPKLLLEASNPKLCQPRKQLEVAPKKIDLQITPKIGTPLWKTRELANSQVAYPTPASLIWGSHALPPALGACTTARLRRLEPPEEYRMAGEQWG